MDAYSDRDPDPLVVATTGGLVRGCFQAVDTAGELDDNARGIPDTAPQAASARVRSWRGIPFGDDTAGAGRFRAPRPVPAWEGVRECTAFGAPAPQPTYSWTDKIIGSEDCLHLDVVRPDTDETLPVVVYLHGGSFIVGSSHMLMLRGYALAQAMNVVYVSVNFRLGALGYLDLRSLKGDCCANPAVADQILALEWVRDNAAAFGGDPNRVTLMGESAGGAAVLTLMTSPAAEGLFHRAIAQSPPIGTVHSRTQSTLWTRELVHRLALPRLATVDDVRAEDCADIIRAGQSMMWKSRELLHLNSCYAPTVDGDLVPEHPLSAFEKGKAHPVPLIIGTNSDEASFGKFLFQREFSRRRAGKRLLASFDPEAAPQVLAAYNQAATRSDFAELLADALFWAPAVHVAGAHAAVAPTWMYRFDFAPVALRWLGLGAMHSLELSSLFGDPDSSRAAVLTRIGSQDSMDELSATMQNAWARFIHGEEPSPEWPRYDTAARQTMIFDAEPAVVSDPKQRQRQAWQAYHMRNWGAGRPELAQALGFIDDWLQA